MIRYYSTQRPVAPGTYIDNGKVVRIQNYDTRIYVAEIGREAWGYIDYEEPIPQNLAKAYELVCK